jgi:hypothetical protein
MMKTKILQKNTIVAGKHKNTRVIARSKVDGILILNGTDDERMSGVFFQVGGSFECLRISSSGRLLWCLTRTFEYYKERGIS